MTYTHTRDTIKSFLINQTPFDQLSASALEKLMTKLQPLRYRMGQALLVREKLPTQVIILYEGQARLLGYDPRTNIPVTLQILEPGTVIGWAGLVRGIACETVTASTELIGFALPAADFLALLTQESSFRLAFQDQCSLIELFDLLGAQLAQQADGTVDLKELATEIGSAVQVRILPTGRQSAQQLDPDWVWLVSSGVITNYPVGSRLIPNNGHSELKVESSARLVGFRERLLQMQALPALTQASLPVETIPYAPEVVPEPVENRKQQEQYPLVRGRGALEEALACFQMLSKSLNIPFRREVIRRVLGQQLERAGELPLSVCGAVAELMGLNAQLVTVPATAVPRLQAPALVRWQDQLAVLFQISDKELVIGIPSKGIVRCKPAEFMRHWGEEGQVLLLKTTPQTPQQRFSLSWFLPSLWRYRKVLFEVLVASFFVQLFGLANPLIVQIIIDKVLVQNSLDTLQVLGIFLLVVAVFEALLGALRTYLFVDTTNRIDMALGAEIIDHLLRLPLRYFEKRPVGELSTRVNELENIRQFLTGTALTVVLDAIFSVIYIVVMAIYSWVLTLVALSTIPLFALVTFLASPIIRKQLRTKAERNAEAQSYFVEAISGIQTVKAQNIELRSRWQWQERYGRYVSAGFNTVLTATAANSFSQFLNQLSGLLLLWVGAYLVLKGQLTLGQLIAFRIIAGYTTSPLLRLVQLWQNFQETALSLERLSDIVDTPREAEDLDRQNIPMPAIQGAVKYENVTFRFASNGSAAPQLLNVSLDFPAGTFVGVVGQSGSGKSTLMKLLPRLYEAEAGRILVDGYDISKVELYSLRQQIGLVLQDPLLFDGTVQENIALAAPEASPEEIIYAAKVAVAHDFIMSLPNGYNTRVGERGSALSGGQRQRIAIARMVLQNPQLLVLDEATSALDYNTERQVCQNLVEVFRGRSIFCITHRLSTIRNADVIVVMDQGAVVEQGTHDELTALKGRYYCLYQQQQAQL
jgi:ATP-binding cassette, subfamily B, bacterial HlyB/CyaB